MTQQVYNVGRYLVRQIAGMLASPLHPSTHTSTARSVAPGPTGLNVAEPVDPGTPSSRPALTVPVPSGDWVAVVQQVLDGMPGRHLVLEPIRDGDHVTDYVVAAASPDPVDFSGQPLRRMVGRLISEVYPAAVAAPTWRTWHDVLADGCPREVGPFRYAGDGDRAPTDVWITAWVRRVGPGLLSSWARHDEEARLAERIARTERLAQLGWAEADLLTGEITWSDELYRVYERDPALGPMSTPEIDALTLPEDEPIRRQALEAVRAGHGADITYRVRVGGRIKHLRGVIDAVRDAHGRLLKVYGIAQDVTAQETSRVHIAETRRQLIDQQQSLDAEHRLAAQLQQIVLPVPAEPFDLSTLRVAVRYLPAQEADRVGGDWFHAAAAHDGSVVLAVGDVAGHGIRAATVMAQVRHLLAGLTVTATSDPAELLGHLNRLLCAEGTTATAAVARYHPDNSQVLWAQAGHPAPLHTRAARTAQLPRPHGILLGAARSTTYATETLRLDPGDLLLFYTDGLVEHRDDRHDEGLAAVITALDDIAASGTAQPLAELLAQLPRANPDDDTCILAVRHHQLSPTAAPAAEQHSPRQPPGRSGIERNGPG